MLNLFKIKFCLLLSCFSISLSLVAEITNNELFENKNILIFGGTGFLGRALTAELLKYNPKSIIIFSRDEVKHFNCAKIFNNNPKIKSIIGDIRDYNKVLKATESIDIVFHAAALKRIDILEYNVEESIKTNIIGSLNVFNACVANKVKQVLFVSTDKACSPINTYGACKFISEKIFTNYDKKQTNTKCVVVRYGNVLESTGSVIPIFMELIKKGEDIPLTDERMTRFIISKEEAIQFVFDALRYSSGGEIFVKKLPAFKITDLIDVLKDMFEATNTVKVTGIRPGEKMHEKLVNKFEMARIFEFNNYFVITPSVANLSYAGQQELPIYVKEGKLLDLKFVEKYSSDQAVISKDALYDVFKKLNIQPLSRTIFRNMKGQDEEDNCSIF